MTNYLIVPGLGNSGPEHWQTYFERSGNLFHRVVQADWDAPVCIDWIEAIDQKICEFDTGSVVLVGHSLGCAAIVHWAAKCKRSIGGAMLVAPSDPEADCYTFPAKGFSPIPLGRLAFPSLVVASDNDVWVSLDRARFFAESWGARFVNLGAAGHINVDSGHTNWDEGLRLLEGVTNSRK